MFRTVKICILFTTFMSETWSFLTSQASETLGQDQNRQSQEPVNPIPAKNALTTGQMLVQLGKLALRELSYLAGIRIGGDLLFSSYETDTNPTLGFNLGPEFGPAQGAVDSVMVTNVLTTGQYLAKLGKQELRELSNLAGIQIGRDLLYGSCGTERNPSCGINLGSNSNSSLPSITIVTQKSVPPPNTQASIQQTQSPAQPASLSPFFNSDSKNNNELVYKPNSLPVPQLLESAETTQTSVMPSMSAPPFKGSYNPLAEDDFHLSFSVPNPTSGSKKTTDPLLYPVHFYSQESLRVASLQDNPEVMPSNRESNYDNFDAW